MRRVLFVAALAGCVAAGAAAAAPETAAKPAVARDRAKSSRAPAAKARDATPDGAKPGIGKGGQNVGGKAAAGGAAQGAAATPAPARGGGMLPGGESREPIVIDADKLEWFDKEQKAIYTGNVVATQGEATLKASQLRIFLLKPEKAPGSAPAAAAAPAASPGVGIGVGGDNQIERMEADGPVELIQKDQTATGDKGFYERGANAVTLIGNVALRQAGHITLGDRLVYDLDTRQAVVQKPRGTFAPRNQPANAPKR